MTIQHKIAAAAAILIISILAVDIIKNHFETKRYAEESRQWINALEKRALEDKAKLRDLPPVIRAASPDADEKDLASKLQDVLPVILAASPIENRGCDPILGIARETDLGVVETIGAIRTVALQLDGSRDSRQKINELLKARAEELELAPDKYGWRLLNTPTVLTFIAAHGEN
jgi:hypothetical protein